MRFWKNMKESQRHKWDNCWRIGKLGISVDLSINLRTFGLALWVGFYSLNKALVLRLGPLSIIAVAREES